MIAEEILERLQEIVLTHEVCTDENGELGGCNVLYDLRDLIELCGGSDGREK